MAPPPPPPAPTVAPTPTPVHAQAPAIVDHDDPVTALDHSPSTHDHDHQRAMTATEHLPLPHHHRPQQDSPATMSASFSINPNRPFVTPVNRRQPFEELGYELRETLGEGEFGKVKLAIHKATGNKVAIKVFKRARLDDPEKQNKLRREIAILSAVIHKSIVRLFEVLETDELVGLVIEYASGGELFDYILNNKYLNEDEAGRLFAQLIDGVNYLHQKCVVHRDLKLENLLLSDSKNLVIIDFGFANQFPDPADLQTPAPEAPFSDPLRAQSIPDRHFLMATSCGSPCYAAPELVVADGYVGTCADVWSCGVILFAMLAGYLPFDDDPENPHGDNITLLYKYILSEPTPLHMPPHLSANAQDLLRCMLVPDPDKRATMKEVMEHPWLAAYRHFFTKDFSAPPPVPQKDPHRSKSSSKRSKSRSRPAQAAAAEPESVAITTEATTSSSSASSSTQKPATAPSAAQVSAPTSFADVTTVPNSTTHDDAMDVDTSRSPVLPVPVAVGGDDAMQVDPAIAALLAASPAHQPVAPAVESSAATSTAQLAVTASADAPARRVSVDNSQLAAPAAVSFPALSGAAAAAVAGETSTSTKKSAKSNNYKRNTFSGPSSSGKSPGLPKHGFLDDLKHSIAKLKWRSNRTKRTSAATTSATSSMAGVSPAAPQPVHITVVPATATPSEASSPMAPVVPPQAASPIAPPAILLAPPTAAAAMSPSASPRGIAPTNGTPPPPPPPPKQARQPTNHASVLATLTRGRQQDVVFTRTDISQDTVHQVFDPTMQVAPTGSATQGRQRSKSVGGRSMVASIRSLVDGGASTAVYERTDVPPVPDLPDTLPTAPVGPYQSVYGSAGAAAASADGDRGRSVDKQVTIKRGRSLTDKLLGRNKKPAEVPPPLPTGFFNTLTPAVVSVDDARQFPAEALTTRTPEVALFEVRKVLEGLGAVVVGHGTDPVRGIPGHGDGPFLLKCRLKLGKKGVGVTPARLKAELDALSLLDNDEDYAPVALPSVEAAAAAANDSGSRPPGAHRRRKSTATTSGSTSDALSVYSSYSVGATSTSGSGSAAQVLPEDYPALYTQPDVAAAIAAGRTGPVMRSVTPVIPAGTLQSATGGATTSNATAVAYEQTMLASSANAAEASNGMYLNKSVSVHYSSYYSSTPTMSGNARAINEGVHVGSVAKAPAPAENKGAMQVIKRGLMSFGTDLLFTVEIVGLPEHKSTWAIKFHRTKGSSVSYGRVKQIVLRKLYRSDDKLRQLLG